MGGGIDRNHLAAQQHFHALFLPELGRADIEPVKGLLAGEIFLGQGRTLIGQLGLAADHGHRSLETTLTQGNSTLRACMARSNDQDILVFHEVLVAHHARSVKSCHAARSHLGRISNRSCPL